jgi:hypothetical protein
MYKIRATFECDFQGQKANYADTTTEGRLVCESYSDYTKVWRPIDVNEKQAKNMLRGLASFVEGKDTDPFAPVLRSFVRVDEGIWYVFIVARYND